MRVPLPLVSVLTPLYNAEAYIEEVLAAVRAQVYPEIEHIVVDDGSTDRSAELVERFVRSEPRARLMLVRQDNQGEAAAVNRALELSSGQYLVVVNADDPPLTDLVRSTVEVLESSPDAVVAYPDWVMIDASGAEIREVRTLEYSQQALVADYVCIPGPGALIRRAALEGDVLRDPRYRFVSDYALWLRLSLRGSMIRCPAVLASWRRHDAGATATGRGIALAAEFRMVIKDFFGQAELPPEVRQWERQARSMATYHAAIQKLYDPSVPGRRLMLRSLFTPFRRRSSYATYRRKPLVVLAVFLSPLGTRIVRRKSG